MNDDARERIETKLAFLELANGELSDVVFRQQRVIDALQAQVAALWARVHASQESGVTPRRPEDERPPHY
jgi:SlyX protein